MKQNISAMTQLLKTPEGQRLLALVKKSDPKLMQEAMAAMQAGDTAKATALLSPLAQQKEIKELLVKIQGGGVYGG